MVLFGRKREEDEKLEDFLKQNPGVEIDRDWKGHIKKVIFPKDTKESTFMICDDKVCFITYLKKGENDYHTFSASLEGKYIAIINTAQEKYSVVGY